jgi:hypothetical protein
VQPGHVFHEASRSDGRLGQPPQHTARALPADQPAAAFSRPDLPAKNHQAGSAQKPGRRMVIAHITIVSQAAGDPRYSQAQPLRSLVSPACRVDYAASAMIKCGLCPMSRLPQMKLPHCVR